MDFAEQTGAAVLGSTPKDGGDQYVLRIHELSKTFGETAALTDVSMSVRRASVHALLGGNGSGKSTLVKILAGVMHGDSGSIEASGQRVDAARTSPDWARQVGLHFVHQSTGVFQSLSVAENFALGGGYGAGSLSPIRWKSVHRRVKEVLERFEIDVPASARMDSLGPATQTMIAVARALQDEDDEDRGRGVLVLDEPTAALPAEEVETLHAAIRDYIGRGHTVILVSHRLDEVLTLCTDASFLKDGVHTDTISLATTDERGLIRAIAGADAIVRGNEGNVRLIGEERLGVKGLSVGVVKDCTLAVARGEILGISGLAGSGRSTLLQGIFGNRARSSGRIELDGRAVAISSPDEAVRLGIAYLPEDRTADAAFLEKSLRENLAIPDLGRYWRRIALSRRPEVQDADNAIKRYEIVIGGQQHPVSTMSGGNQQKAMLARWLELSPRVLLLDEPTQGVDVGARRTIHNHVRRVAEEGCAVIVVSSDASELANLCDRVIGLVNGEIREQISGDEVTTARCLEVAAGLTSKEAAALEALAVNDNSLE